MGVQFRTPSERTCERCGRKEEWDADAERWGVERQGDEPVVGNVFCLHEWDINGSFLPIENPESDSSHE
ncbi:MAG: HEWD family protein [Haloferacaceae archaeon]